MNTLIIRKQKDIEDYKLRSEICNLDLTQWEGGDLVMQDVVCGSFFQHNKIFNGAFTQIDCHFKDYFNQELTTFNGDFTQINCTFEDYFDQGYTTLNGSFIQTGCMFKSEIYQTGAMFNGSFTQTNCTFEGAYYQRDSTFNGKVTRIIAKEDIDFLKGLPLDILDMRRWQSNKNWLEVKSLEGLHICGTTFCIRGYAEAEYYVKHGKRVEDENKLIPNLKYMFYMSQEQALTEIQTIISSN